LRSGSFQIPPMERVFFGHPFDEVIAEEVERLEAKRVFLLVSNTLSRKTGEIEKVRRRLGGRFAADFDEMPPNIPRDAVLRAAAIARAAEADVIVTIGGGSVNDAGKNVQICLEHNIVDLEGFEPFRLKTDPSTGRPQAPDVRPPSVRQIAVPMTLSGSSRIAPTRRTMAASLGKMPTTSVRRLISPLTRSRGLVLCSFGRCRAGKLM
jgi:maleylacetate reductase